jgi:nucleoside-diphosphate-sugar epimerase
VQNLLVTGGAGYVGSRLVPFLIEQGYCVRVLDLFIFNKHVFDHLRSNPRLELIEGDIRHHETVDHSLEDIDTVIHLAAISNDLSCVLDPLLTQQVNFDAVKYLVESAKQHGVKQLINTSSASVYGSEEEAEISEEFKLKPLTLYAKYKAESEALVTAANSQSLATTNIRAATLCGYSPRQRLDLVVNTFTYQALSKGKITVFGGEQKRPNLTLRDMLEVYALLLRTERRKIAGEVFNVGFENYEVKEIAGIVKSTLGLEIEIETLVTSDSRSYRISSEKIVHTLGFVPRYTVADAVNELRNAFEDGRIPDPDHPRYYNVRLMKESRLI